MACLALALGHAGCDPAAAAEPASSMVTAEEVPVSTRAGGSAAPPLGAVPSTAAASERPSFLDWRSAPDAPEVRVTQPGCRAQRLREWVRVDCGGHVGASLVTGNREGVHFEQQVDRESDSSSFTVVFPVRRGDRRVLELLRWSKWAPGVPDVIITEQWLEGDARALITVQGVRGM